MSIIRVHLTCMCNHLLCNKVLLTQVLKYVFTLGKWSGMGIKAEKFIYLKETSNCTDKSFREIWEPFYANYHGFEKCP